MKNFMNIKKSFLWLSLLGMTSFGLFYATSNIDPLIKEMEKEDIKILIGANIYIMPISLLCIGRFPIPFVRSQPLYFSEIPLLSSASIAVFLFKTGQILLQKSAGHSDNEDDNYLCAANALVICGSIIQVGLMCYTGYQRYKKTIDYKENERRLQELLNKKR